MQARYGMSCPNLIKDEKGNVIETHHNHAEVVDYRFYGSNKESLNQVIDQQRVSVKGCITFFKTYAEDKTADVALRAAANAALEEDKARLKDLEDHKKIECRIQ